MLCYETAVPFKFVTRLTFRALYSLHFHPLLPNIIQKGFLKYGGFETLKPMLYDSPLVYGHGGKLAVLLLAGGTLM
jgi:hypothetical protein